MALDSAQVSTSKRHTLTVGTRSPTTRESLCQYHIPLYLRSIVHCGGVLDLSCQASDRRLYAVFRKARCFPPAFRPTRTGRQDLGSSACRARQGLRPACLLCLRETTCRRTHLIQCCAVFRCIYNTYMCGVCQSIRVNNTCMQFQTV